MNRGNAPSVIHGRRPDRCPFDILFAPFGKICSPSGFPVPVNSVWLRNLRLIQSKFHYNFWRPFTAIRNAAIDGNANTAADPIWEPFLPTPPVQDYPSTHSALGNAAATVLTSVLGDNLLFSFQSATANPVNATRQFKSFKQAALENADSRVMAGLHFRFSCDAGLTLGNNVGNWIVQHQLNPVN
jgi:hypothetical protein